jgi:hypothetical protein
MRMEASGLPEMLAIFYQTVRRHLTEDTDVHIDARENVMHYECRCPCMCLVQKLLYFSSQSGHQQVNI